MPRSDRIEPSEARGFLACELNEGADRFRAEFDLKNAKARLYRNGRLLSEAASALDRAGRFHVTFANVDDRLILWLNGKLLFGDGLTYEPPDDRRPTPGDLLPASIAVRGAPVRVSNLVLKRDIYYTHSVGGASASYDYDVPGGCSSLQAFLRDPVQWDPFANLRPSNDFNLSPDEFFVLGDNSPQSRDSRAWDRGHAVPRQLMIGNAFFIYWPHAVPFGPKVPGTNLQPLFYPQFGRMKFIK